MRQLILLIISILSTQISLSQINEIGVFVGGSNFIGDIGSTTFIAPDQLAIGGMYKWNGSQRHAFRLSLIHTELQGIDNKSDDPRRIARDYEFNTGITEISAGIELNFIKYDLHSGDRVASPYMYSGITAAYHSNSYFDGSGIQTKEDSSNISYGIPMVLGYKSNFLGRIVVAIEVGARYTFSDKIDGSTPNSKKLGHYTVGNPNNNDWYMFSGLTLTYTFGRNPCFCIR